MARPNVLVRRCGFIKHSSADADPVNDLEEYSRDVAVLLNQLLYELPYKKGGLSKIRMS